MDLFRNIMDPTIEPVPFDWYALEVEPQKEHHLMRELKQMGIPSVYMGKRVYQAKRKTHMTKVERWGYMFICLTGLSVSFAEIEGVDYAGRVIGRDLGVDRLGRSRARLGDHFALRLQKHIRRHEWHGETEHVAYFSDNLAREIAKELKAFAKGERVRILDGPFQRFEGVVKSGTKHKSTLDIEGLSADKVEIGNELLVAV